MESKKRALMSPTGAQRGNSPLHLFGGGYFFMTESAKPFKTLEEQIDLLRKRGLIITDEIKVKNLLLSNNYYNIINGYSKFFPTEKDSYTNGTSFDEVMRLYTFDTELKRAFFKALLETEAHLKAIFAYRFAEEYHHIRYSYLDIACYDPNRVLDAVQTIHKLSGIINRQKNFPDSSIHHYVRAYGNVPIWVLVNYIDFGDLRYMIINSKKSIQNKVAHDMLDFAKQNIDNFNRFPPENMIDLLANLNELRNICAHNNRMIGFKCRRDSKYWPELHDRYNLSQRCERRDVYSLYISLQCFLSETEFSFLHNTVRKRLRTLSNGLKSITMSHILSLLGFPNDWHLTAPIKQQK